MSDVEHSETYEPHGSSKTYFVVFILLCICTGVSWLVDEMHINNLVLLVVTVLAIASLKASFVLLYFMHLKFEKNWKYALLLPTTILAIGLPMTLLPDIGLHYYTNVNPQSLTTVKEATSETATSTVEEETSPAALEPENKEQ
ncbi:cytochrome C oxidase subunit IV family protein [Polystyrenella longa]|nr:cytochrome C oxidase subunit IV family protein [Polystyrenella longa]